MADTEVVIDLAFDTDDFRYRLKGEGKGRAVVGSNDDDPAGGTDSRRALESLPAGSYTIEATT